MEEKHQLDLSVIILSFRSTAHLKVLIPSIYKSQTRYSFEVIVVDNDSKDGTAEFVETLTPQFKNLKLIRNVNNGFAAGNNVGIKQAVGRFILLLNPDTEVMPDTFETMLNFMEAHPEVGMSGCKLIKGNGKLDLACRRRFPNPWNSFSRLFLLNNKDYNYSDIDENTEMEVDSLVGAFILTRKDVLDKVGLLDEDFFMYGEDLDWCWRCKEGGFKVWYYPKTYIYHYKGESSKKTPFRALKWFHDSMWIFYKKHYYKKYPQVLSFLVYLGIYGRLMALWLVNSLKSNPKVSK